jgi:hypothetical protein
MHFYSSISFLLFLWSLDTVLFVIFFLVPFFGRVHRRNSLNFFALSFLVVLFLGQHGLKVVFLLFLFFFFYLP